MKKILLATFIIGILTSCADMVDDLNQNPNNPNSAPYEYVLTSAEVANIVLQTGEASRRAGIFAGQFTGIGRQHQSYSDYILAATDFDSQWRSAFSSVLRNAIVAEDLAQAQGVDGVTIGVLQVIKALAFGTAASLWGDIPFDQAGRLEFENPEFESQVVVYGKIQTLLDEAITNLSTGTGRAPANTEIYFDGAPTSWIQVAYTLKARYYMHTKEYANAYTAALSGIGSTGSFGANDMRSPHGTATGDQNLYYQFFELASRKSDLVTSAFFASIIDSNLGRNPIPANYRGHAKTNETARYNYLLRTTSVGIQPNTATNGFAQIDASAPIVTYAENQLILAEAGARADFNTGLSRLNEFRSYMNTGGYLVNPTMANVLYAPFVAADFNNLGIENPDGLTPVNALLREIMQERYVTLFGQIEVFNDVRRTLSETQIRVMVQPNQGSLLPQRFLYAQDEINTNSSVPNPIPNLFEATEVNQ
jgi:hypothetical protein